MPILRTALGPSATATILLLLTTLFWGGNAVAGKFAVGEVSPMLLTFFRWAIASILLVCLFREHLIRDWPIIRSRIFYLFLMGAVGFAGFNGLFYYALNFTTAINVAILQAAMPMVIFALNFTLFGVPVTWQQGLGYALTLVGVVIVATRGDLHSLTSFDFNRGDLIMLVAAIVYGAYSVALARKPQLSWQSFLAVIVVSAAVAAVPMAAVEYLLGNVTWPMSLTGWSVIGYTAIFPSILGQGFYIRGNELIGGNRAGLYINLVPVFGAVLAVALLSEVFHTFHAVSMVLVVGGIWLAQAKRKSPNLGTTRQ